MTEAYSRDVDFDDFEEEEMPSLSGWGTPYNKWKKKGKKEEDA